MASTITGTLNSWTITSPGGEVCGAAKNEAQATLDPDGTVVIKSGDAVLWAGHIMSLVGLVGATPALLFADLLNSYLTGSSSSPVYSLAAGRFGVDSSTNPGPVIGGLLFDPTLTTAGNWIIPMTSATLGLGLGDNYEDDTDDYFTLTSPTALTINVTGKYHLSMGWFVLTSDPLAPVVVQVLKNGENIFTAPPAVNDFNSGSTTGTSPISGLYTRAYSMNGAMDSLLTAGDIISCKLYAEGGSGGDTAEISLTSALCIHLIGGTSSGAGTSGITAVNNQTSAGESLVENPGAGPVIGVKRLLAGTNITLTPTSDDITIDASGGASTTIANLGGPGQTLVTGAAPAYSVKRIRVTTSGLTVGSDANSIFLTNALIYNTSGFGLGEDLVSNAGYPIGIIKKIRAGSGIAVTSDTNAVIITASANNGFLVNGSSGVAFTTTPTAIAMGTYKRNDGSFTWTGSATTSVAAQTVIQFDVGFSITTASTGITTFRIRDSGSDLLVRSYPAGYTGSVVFSGTVKSFYGGTISIQASSTVADGAFDTSGTADDSPNWFSGNLVYAP